jgi:hypothetical protein
MNQKEWTIMIYMAGDNNLAVDMAYAMEQIKSVAGSRADSPNLFVYYDGNSPAIPTGQVAVRAVIQSAEQTLSRSEEGK